jgi:hypothetical protein
MSLAEGEREAATLALQETRKSMNVKILIDKDKVIVDS